MKKPDIPKILFFAACAGLFFVYGVVVEAYKVFPYQLLNFARDSVVQAYAEMDMMLGKRPTEFLRPARHEGSGITKLDESKAAPGLTFIAGFFNDGTEMRLLRLDGTVIHRWPVRYSEIWPDPQHIRPANKAPRTDWNTDIHGALALPDGSVVFNFEYMGLAKVDRCGHTVWAVPRMTHHSITRAQDGGFWVGGRHFEDTRSAFPSLGTPYHEDTILKISADGDVQSEISVPGLFYKNGLVPLLVANGVSWIAVPESEIVHLNDIEELSAAMAEAFPTFADGDLLISMRTHNLVMVVDPATETVKWHQTGPWLRQHDPDFQPDGTITLFNNNSDDTHGELFGGSNIMQLDPTDGTTRMLYGTEPGQKFYTEVRGKHQVLDNGNILITEHSAGRIFEITPSGKIVWEFINRYDESDVAAITSATRYAENYFTVEDWSCE